MSSASGRTTTVAAEVWMRPCVSVAGAVHSGFVLEARVDFLALDEGDDLLEAAGGAGRAGQDLELPAPALGVARVHAEQVAGEDRRFVTAGAGAHFQIEIALVARIARDQEQAQAAVQFGDARFDGGNFFFCQRAHFRIVAQCLRRGEIVQRLRVFAQCGGDRFELRVFFRERAKARVVGQHRWLGEQAADFLVAFGQGFELTAQAGRHRIRLDSRTGARRRAAIRRRH
jgi:hypothetical protein